MQRETKQEIGTNTCRAMHINKSIVLHSRACDSSALKADLKPSRNAPIGKHVVNANETNDRERM